MRGACRGLGILLQGRYPADGAQGQSLAPRGPATAAGLVSPPRLAAGDRLLRKRVVRDGQGGPRPRPGQEVSVKALGAVEDGSLVCRRGGWAGPALELGVPTMELGEICLFLAAPSYGYGRLGREPDVPPEAPLLFEVTLLEVRDDPDPQRLPPAARLRLGAQKRERGNFHFAMRLCLCPCPCLCPCWRLSSAGCVGGPLGACAKGSGRGVGGDSG
uniref:peptidylprolyl isomerase n=1 Tax=Nothoprocta perdicaria TaxID=30464 RepID=A0A8C6ZLV5_NOTPE